MNDKVMGDDCEFAEIGADREFGQLERLFGPLERVAEDDDFSEFDFKNRGSDRTARTAPDRTARTAPDSFGQQTAGQQTARQQAQSQRLATTLQRWEGRCWAVILNPPNNKSLN